jgi:hypothetical protein
MKNRFNGELRNLTLEHPPDALFFKTESVTSEGCHDERSDLGMFRVDAMLCNIRSRDRSRDVMWTESEYRCAMIEVRPQEYNTEVPVRT